MSPRRIRSKQHIRKRRAARLRRLKLYTLGAVFVLAILVGLTHLNAVKINSITVDTEPDISDSAVQEEVPVALEDRWLWLIARDNILLLPRAEIRNQIRALSSRIKAVDVNVTGLRSVEIMVEAREPVARACGAEASECHFIGADGLLFSSDEESDTDLLTYHIASPLRGGTQLLPTATFRSINAFIAALEDINLDAQQVEIQEGGDLVIPVTSLTTATSTDAVDLRVNMYKDLEQTAANLQTVIANRSFVAEGTGGDAPAEPISPFSLEYIDMRFDNKVFYK